MNNGLKPVAKLDEVKLDEINFDEMNFDDIEELEEIVTPGNGTIHCCC